LAPKFKHKENISILDALEFITGALNYNRQVNIAIIDAPKSITGALKYKLEVNFAIIAVLKSIVTVPNSDCGFFFARP